MDNESDFQLPSLLTMQYTNLNKLEQNLTPSPGRGIRDIKKQSHPSAGISIPTTSKRKEHANMEEEGR